VCQRHRHSGDVALKPATNASAPLPMGLVPAQSIVVPTDQTLDKLAELLNKARRVTLLCGSGCESAHDELMQLAEALKAPIVHALRGKEHVEWENPYDVGMTGLIGSPRGYQAMEACDALLCWALISLSASSYEGCPASPKSTSGRGDRSSGSC